MQRSAIGDALTQALKPVQFWFTNFVMTEVQNAFTVITLNRKDLAENGLQAQVLSFLWIDVRLKEFRVGIVLHFNQIRRSDYLFDFSEIDSFSGF